MMAVWALAISLGALIAVHMARPFLENRKVSAARFFSDLPPVKQGTPRLRIANPLLSPPFYLRLAVLSLLLAAVLSNKFELSAGSVKRVGLWILVDTSASMSTRNGETDRMAAAKLEIQRLVGKVRKKNKDTGFCVKLSAFDLERRDLLETGHAESTDRIVAGLEPRMLGTDLNLVRRLFDTPPESPDCEITHIAVVTDQPAPDWASGAVWTDVAAVENNVGFTDIRASRNRLTGVADKISLTVRAFGEPPRETRLEILAPDKTAILDETLSWNGRKILKKSFAPTLSGSYTLRLSKGGAYIHDDEAVISIPGKNSVRVDWRIDGGKEIPALLKWDISSTMPDMRVVSRYSEEGGIPTLVVGDGYNRTAERTEILFFDETSLLLEDLNFDIVETLRLPSANQPKGFEPVLSGVDGRVFAAVQKDPPAVCIPGLPVFTDDNTGRFSTTLFFNAVRQLLGERPKPPLFSLTTPNKPIPEGNRLALHPGEGNTAMPAKSLGRIEDIRPTRSKAGGKPLWPILLALAALFYATERLLNAHAGSKWR